MRKLIAFAFVLFSLGASAQSLQYSTTYGYRYRRLLVDSISGLPSDTFRIPTALRSKVWLAGRSGTGSLYIWNTTNLRWEAISGGGGGVSDGNKGDITVSGSSSVWTINNTSITNAKIRDAVALSILGRSANSTGSIADIVAGSDGNVLRRSGTSIGFGSVDLANTNAVTGLLADANISSASTWNAKISNAAGLVTGSNGITRTGSGTSGTPYNFGITNYAPPRNWVVGNTADGVVGMLRVATFDSTNRNSGDTTIPAYVAANGTHNYLNATQLKSWLANGSSSSSGIKPKWLVVQVGVSNNAPADGATTLAHDSLINHGVMVWGDGLLLRPNSDSTNGYRYDKITGIITFGAPLVANQVVQVLRTDSFIDTLTAQAIPASWIDVTYATATGLTESPAKVWTGTNTGFTSFGLSSVPLTGTGWYIFKSGTPGSNANGLIGFRTTNSNSDYTSYNFGVYLSEESGHLRVNHIDAGTPTAVAGAVYGVGYINYGDYAGLFRDVSTGVVTLKTSADKVTWTTSWTFAATSTATLYTLINPFNGTAIYQPQTKVGP